MTRELISYILRQTKLLPIVDQIVLRLVLFKNYNSNRKFRRTNPSFRVPPNDLAYDAYATVNYETYYKSGSSMANFLYELACKHLSEGQLKICEWGCGPGRVVRHLPSISPNKEIRVYGTDYNSKTIQWCQSYIKGVTFALNGSEPPLPFGDNQFDFLYSLSVFTHIPKNLQFAWLEENLRVVHPNGLVFMTFHGDSYKERLLRKEKEEYETDGIVVRDGVKEGSKLFVAYHNPTFVEKTFLNGFEIVFRKLYSENDPADQDWWLIRKPV